MTQPMPWVEDVARGDWVPERLDAGDGGAWSIHVFVPHGFEAYARVLHPLGRVDDRSPDTGPAPWSEIADAFGTPMHPLADLDRLAGRLWCGGDEIITPQGVTYEWPCEGRIPASVLGPLATHLAACTTTPGAGVVGIWEGIGGLVCGAGRATFVFSEPEPGMPQSYGWFEAVPRWTSAWRRLRVRLLTRRARPGRAPRRRDLRPGTGILAADAAAGPRLELPYRAHILFEAGIERFGDDAWIADAPWLDSFDRACIDPQTPAIAWPDDHAWTIANDTDIAWTYVAGSRALVDALVADPRLEAYEIPEGSVPDYPEYAD